MCGDFSESEECICREINENGSSSVTKLSRRTDFPTWKVSRILKRLEIRGLVRYEVEDRDERGRPRKFYELEPEASTLLSEEDDLSE